MRDFPEQTDAQPAYASQPSALRERLVRLLTAPVGVIDVRYAQQKYARIAEWLDKRSALLERLQARYGVGEGFADNQPLLMQEQLEAVNFHSTTFQSFSTVQPFSTEPRPSIVEQSAAQSEMPEALAQSFLPAELTQAYADSATAPTSSEALPISSEAFPISTGEAPLIYTSRRVTDISQLPEGEFRVSRRRAQFNPSPVPSTTPALKLPLADTHARTETAADAPLASEPVAAREISRTEIVAPPQASTPELPLAYARPVVLTKEARKENERPSELTTSPQPIARTVTGASESQSVSGESESVAGESKSAVASEIKDASFTQARTEIVWRKGSADVPTPDADSRGQNQSGGNLTSDARQVDGHPFERQAQPSSQINSHTKEQRQDSEIRIEQLSPRVINTISERVIRAISHDLAIELERRGLKKWH